VALASIWFAAHAGTGIACAPGVEPPVRVIVKFRDVKDTAPERAGRPMVKALGERMGVALRPLNQRSGGVQVLLAPEGYSGDEVDRLVRNLAGDPQVQYAEPDARRCVRLIPPDTRFNEQTYLMGNTTGINAPPAWDITTTTGVAGTVAAVVDTGVLPNHQDLDTQLVTGYDFISADPDGGFDTAADGDGRDDDPSDPGDWVTAGAGGPPAGPAQLLARHPGLQPDRCGPERDRHGGGQLAGLGPAGAGRGPLRGICLGHQRCAALGRGPAGTGGARQHQPGPGH
jgi:subtilisin family serine protease